MYSYAQECGSGISEIQFYILNGKNTNISYQILDIDEDSILKILSKKESEDIYSENQLYFRPPLKTFPFQISTMHQILH